MSIRYLSGLTVDSTVLVVDAANDRVGIGTAGPAAKLDIAYSTNPTTATPHIILTTGGTSKQAAITAESFNVGGLVFSTGDGTLVDRMTILRTNGNVGIGTTSPGSKLEVSGGLAHFAQTATTGSAFRWGSFGTAVSPDTMLCMNQLWNGSGWTILDANYGTTAINLGSAAASPTMQFQTGGANTSATTKMIILNNGNVGIGTTSPGAKLEVNGNIYQSSGILYSDHLTPFSGNQLQLLGGGANYLYINGNVGIGTTNPVAKLQVSGTVATDSALADVDAYRIIKPNGGVRTTSNSTENGAIKITYPVGFTYTMHRVKVNVYEYTTNESFTIYFGGYTYAADLNWYNEFAYILDNPQVDRNFTVRFGYDGTKAVVYIGELSSSWTYPQIFIEEVELGYSGQSSTWRDGAWGIGFEASAFQNVTRTVSNTQATNWARNGSSAYYGFGNVGVGTSSPSYTLDVSGTARTTTGTYLGTSSGNVIVGGTTSDLISGFKFIAIGNTAVQYGASTGTYLRIEPGAADTQVALKADARSGAYPPMAFHTSDTERLRITSAGNVGIGTTSPAYKLDVDGGSALDAARFYNSSNAATVVRIGDSGNSDYSDLLLQTNSGTGEIFKAGTGYTSYGGALALNIYNSNGAIAFHPNNTANAMFIATNSNVGIGTTGPTEKLHVDGSTLITYNNSFQGINSVGNKAILARVSPTSGIINYAEYATATNLNGFVIGSDDARVKGNITGDSLEFITNTSTRMTILSGGNVGINTTTPGSTLHVIGDVLIQTGALGVGVSPNATDGRIDASNDIVAFSTSDRRLKENITPIANALEKVRSLTGVEFDWKEETKSVHGYEGHDVGVIAQDVQAVLPEAVRTNDSGYLSVRYEKMIALLVEANKELADRVEQLEKLIK